ncbi:MAG TPA: BTAD domain-containing putative transcriptional regulator [Streptosporangiaceae bacterium]
MRVGILGPLEVRDVAGQLAPLAGPRLRALLIRLAVAGGHAVTVDRLASDLWPDERPDERPSDTANALQALVSRLRQAAGRDLVEYGSGSYRLAIDPDAIDAVAFEHLAAQGRTALSTAAPSLAAGLLADALLLWRGPALADVTDAPFAAGPVARLEELRLTAAEDLTEARLTLGQGSQFVADVEELAAAHPLRERLRGQLMRALYAAGRQAEALAVYDQTRRLLADRLGVDPSPELSAIHLAILRADPSLTPSVLSASPAPPTSPAAPTLPATPVPPTSPTTPETPATPAASNGRQRVGHLPAQLTSFVGREDELERLGKQLGDTRLVTLTGPGGAGKTRLALEAATLKAPELPDGAWFVPLAPVRDAGEIPAAVLAALGIPEVVWVADARRPLAPPPLDRLADALASQRLLLVLDNCEHVIDAVARLAARVLADAPGVRILATSREPLGVTGETLCPVPSLPLPPPGADATDATRFAAIRLFRDRAAAVRPGFTVDADTVASVIAVCTALDGIPLAIELAAARLRSLTLTQVESRLNDRFRLLGIGSRATPDRHQTLRAIVDWSWDLLGQAERAVLRRLSVFRGGATPDAADQICGRLEAGSGPASDIGDVIDVIASLVDKSLVIATGNTDVRYRLLETVRVYADERLTEAGEKQQVQAAHAAYFLALAEDAEPRLRTAEQLRWLDRLNADHDNFSAALRYALDSRNGELGLRLVASLMWYWIMLDFDTEGGNWAREIGELIGPVPPPGLSDQFAISEFAAAVGGATDPDSGLRGPDGVELLRKALERSAAHITPASSHPVLALGPALSAMFSGDQAGARCAMEELTRHRDPWVRAAGLAMGGHLAMNDGDVDGATRFFEQGYDAFQTIGDRWGLIIVLNGQAEVAMARDDPAAAVRALEEGHGYAIAGQATHWGEMHLIPLGRARAAAGDLAGARADLERGVRAARQFGENDDEITGFVELAELARRDGDLPVARRLLEQAREISEPRTSRLDIRLAATRAFSKLGCLNEQEGQLEESARWHRRALELLSDERYGLLPIPVNPALAGVLEGVAALAVARGEAARAAELLGLAHTLHGFSDRQSFEVSRVTAAVTAAIGPDEFTAAYQRGRALTQAEALSVNIDF